jgi:hypothetical protein
MVVFMVELRVADNYVYLPFLKPNNFFPTYFLYFELSIFFFFLVFFYHVFLSCLVVTWRVMCVVELRVADSNVVDNHVQYHL